MLTFKVLTLLIPLPPFFIFKLTPLLGCVCGQYLYLSDDILAYEERRCHVY